MATNTSVTSAIDALRQEMLGDTPSEAYNTFTELAKYIADHKEVSDALTTAIGDKADKATTISGYGITDAYTKSETDTKISETDNDTRVDALESAKHAHSNKAVLDEITENDIAAWNNKTTTKIYYSDTQPSDLAEGDLWFATV